MLSGTSSHESHKLSLAWRSPTPSPTSDAPIFKDRGAFSLWNYMHISFIMAFAFSYKSWYMLFHVQSAFVDVSLHRGSHTSAVVGENMPKLFIIPKNYCGSFLSVGDVMSESVHSLLGSGYTLCPHMIWSCQRREPLWIWNSIYLYLISGFLYDISVWFMSVFCCGHWCQHHTLQLWCH